MNLNVFFWFYCLAEISKGVASVSALQFVGEHEEIFRTHGHPFASLCVTKHKFSLDLTWGFLG